MTVPSSDFDLIRVGRQFPAAGQRRAAIKPAYWLFFLFAAYGPAVNYMGQWRYMEIALLGLLFLNFKQALRYVGKVERRLIMLFVLAAMAHIVSDLVNEAPWQGTVKRVGTYLMLCAIIIAIQWLSRKDTKRMALMLSGYCLSWVLLLYIGSSINKYYAVVPWRLGLGGAVTLFLCVVIATVPRIRRFGGIALMVLAVVHVIMNARTMGALTAITGILAILSTLGHKRLPPKFRLEFVIAIAVLAVTGLTLGMYGLTFAVENRLLPDEMQAKMERQMSHPYGLLAAGRPETVTAIYAISKRPIFGYGSTAYNADVGSFLIEITTLKYLGQDNFEAMLKVAYVTEHGETIPSHSHIFGAWADAGILAIPGWLFVLGLCVYVLSRAMFWRHSWSPLFVYVAITTIWTVLFSPGPTRVDMALKLMVMIYAVHLFQVFDRTRQKQGA